MARRVSGFVRGAASTVEREDTGVMYRLGFTTSELQDRYATDAQTQTPEEMMRLYGRQGKHLHRPTSQHLQSPLLKDQYGIEYTPTEPGSTTQWYARISPAKAKAARAALAEGKSVRANQIGGDIYPPPGTLLTLTRFRKHPINARVTIGADPDEVYSANVRSFETDNRTASTLITFETPVSAAQTRHEMELFATRAQKHGVRLGTERSY